MPEVQTPIQKAPSIKHQPISKRYYFDVALGSVRLTGANTGGAYCLLEVSLAPGIGVPRHIHTREDETYYVKAGDTLIAPRDIPHELRNSGNITNHYLLVFSPSGFEEFVMATALPAPDDAVAPTERQLHVDDPAIAVQNVHRLATEYGIIFCG